DAPARRSSPANQLRWWPRAPPQLVSTSNFSTSLPRHQERPIGSSWPKMRPVHALLTACVNRMVSTLALDARSGRARRGKVRIKVNDLETTSVGEPTQFLT